MLVIEVEFLHGVFRADPDGTAHTGNQDRGEWPPSPARLFSALVAADGTRSACRHTDGSELVWLERQPAPAIEASPHAQLVETALLPRYVVRQASNDAPGTTQEYVGRSATLVRPGVRVAPRHRSVRFCWPEAPPAAVLRGLQLRAARIGYLGCADSPVRVSVTVNPEPPEATPAAGEVFQPSESGQVHVAVIEPGMTERLDAHYDRWLTGGPNVRRSQSLGLRRLARYSAGSSARQAGPDQNQPHVVWLRLDRPVSGRRVLALTEALRGALLTRLDAAGVGAPAVVHGHGFTDRGYDTARYLALPNVGGRRSDGRIHGVAVWLPPGTGPEVVEVVRQALRGQVSLYNRAFETSATPWAGEERPWSANPKRWTVAARRWASAFPVVHERSKRAVDLDEVGRWCDHAGVPRPVELRTGRHPLVAGGVDLAPSEVNRPGRPVRRYGHIEVRFADPVTGPIALGSGRQFGLGLLTPIPEPAP